MAKNSMKTQFRHQYGIFPVEGNLMML